VNRLHAVATAGAVGLLAWGAFALLLDSPASELTGSAQSITLAGEGFTPSLAALVAEEPVELVGEGLTPSLAARVEEGLTPSLAPGSGRSARSTAGTVARDAQEARRGGSPSPASTRRGVAPAPADAGELLTRVAGRVVDANGFPLPGVAVASLDPPARATTNAQGEFSLGLTRSASPDKAGLVIQARADGYETSDHVVISQEAEVELELTLEPRLDTSALTVHLLDAYGERVGQERVFVTPVGSVDTFSSPTNPDGACRIDAFSPGPVVVWLRESEGAQPLLQQTIELLPGENQLELRLP
jgi:hypothetical protein